MLFFGLFNLEFEAFVLKQAVVDLRAPSLKKEKGVVFGV